MQKETQTSSRLPMVVALSTSLVFLLVGLKSCRVTVTESRWFGLSSASVDKGPNWFAIALLVTFGTAAAYAVSKVMFSKPNAVAAGQAGQHLGSTTIPDAETSQPAAYSHYGSNLNKPGNILLLFGIGLWRLGHHGGGAHQGATFWQNIAALSVILGIVLNFVRWIRKLIAKRRTIPNGGWVTSMLVMGMSVLALWLVLIVILFATGAGPSE